MRIIVTGDRDWCCPEFAEGILSRLLLHHGPGFVIVHGGDKGIDRSFAEACAELGIDQEIHSPSWREIDHPEAVIKYDRKKRPFNANAPAIRDSGMLALGADLCLAFHRAPSASLPGRPSRRGCRRG